MFIKNEIPKQKRTLHCIDFILIFCLIFIKKIFAIIKVIGNLNLIFLKYESKFKIYSSFFLKVIKNSAVNHKIWRSPCFKNNSNVGTFIFPGFSIFHLQKAILTFRICKAFFIFARHLSL